MYIPGNYVLSLLTLTPMIPPTAKPTTGSTTLNFYSSNLAATTPEQNSSSIFTITTPHKRGTNPASLKGTHHHHPRSPLLIIPTDLPSIDGCYGFSAPYTCHEVSCLYACKDIKPHILHDTALFEPYRDMKPKEEAKFHDDIISQEKSESPTDTTHSLCPHNTHPKSSSTFPTLESSPQPLPGNLTFCPPVELIFSRGTGESSGLGRVGTALFIELMKEFPDMTAYGVFYDASAYKGTLISGGKLEEGGKDIEGRVRMWVELEREKGQCKETRIVLGGFSLGAAVLQKAKLTPEEQERVDAVVIFGYPWKLRPHKQAQYPLEAAKVWTKCIPQDPVCNVESIFTDGTFIAHKGYVEYVEESVEFIRRNVQRVANGGLKSREENSV